MLNPLKDTWEWKRQGSKLKKFGKISWEKSTSKKGMKETRYLQKRDWETALMQEKKKVIVIQETCGCIG